jgi:excinuclease ABC subunit C
VLPNSVQTKLDTLPASPGVYVFRDGASEVLYVGKARSLRSRVRSYFTPSVSDSRYFIPELADTIGDLETFVVGSEKEAALLENQLIKELKPRYNVKLRDDKDYLSLRLKTEGKWPRLEVVRRPRPDGARYFGPYHSATAARQTLRLVNRYFQLRTCTDAELASRSRPCLQYQIKRCPAPCAKEVDRAEYGEQIRLVGLFLDGRHDELVRDLERKMKGSAGGLEYELAAVYRDQLRAVDRVREQQRVSVVKDVDQDVIGLFRQGDQAEIAVLMVREGKMVGVRTYDLPSTSLPDEELIASFLAEYYREGAFVPTEVIIERDVEAMDGLAEVLADRRGTKVTVVVPQRGARKKLLQMAIDNAAHAFREKTRAREDVDARLGQLAKRLRLPRVPHRIECIDVSHLGGQDTVAVIVALLDGAPDKKRYRSFVVKSAKAGDDYGAMFEVLGRRFARGQKGEAGWELPDLMVVDGGKGQLNVALTALRDLGVEQAVVALAKEKENALGDKLVDRVYIPGAKNAINVRESSALSILALARDEAHRASNALREKRGTKRRFKSELDDVPGVGPKTRARLLGALGSLDAVRRASTDMLVSAGASRKQALAIQKALRPPIDDEVQADASEAEDRAVDNAFAETHTSDPDSALS